MVGSHSSCNFLGIETSNSNFSSKAFNTLIEERLNKVDDLSRSIDRISHDVETLKMKIFVLEV